MQARFSSSLQAAADRWWLAVPVLALLMLVPALLHGHPYVFYDTAQYYEYGAKLSGFAIGKVVGAPGTPDRPAAAEPAADSKAATQAATQVEGQGEHAGIAFYGARSPFYSVWLYTFMRFLGVWAVPFTQALAVGWLVWRLAVHTLAAHRLAWAAGATALATFGGGAWFAVAFLMPDVFAAVALAAVALLFAHADRMSLAERLGIAGLLAVSAVFHATHLVTAAVLCLAGIGVACLWAGSSRGRRPGWWRRPWCWRWLRSLPTTASRGRSSARAAKRPPFAMARIIVDGPGRLYLAEHCGRDAAFAVCAYRDRTFKTTDDFLWEGEAVGGVLQTVPLAERLRLIDEEMSFVLAVAARYPFGVLRAAVANAIRQMTLVWPSEGVVRSRSAVRRRLAHSEADRGRAVHPGLHCPARQLHPLASAAGSALDHRNDRRDRLRRNGSASRRHAPRRRGRPRRGWRGGWPASAGGRLHPVDRRRSGRQRRGLWRDLQPGPSLSGTGRLACSRCSRDARSGSTYCALPHLPPEMGKGIVGQRRFERGQESWREPSRLTGAAPG